MEITYNDIQISDQYLSPEVTQIKPIVSLTGLDTNKTYTLIMSDPNAVGGNKIHWLVININGTSNINNIETGKAILEYYGPRPPPESGEHNYIFSLYESNKNNKINQIERQIELAELLTKLDITGKPIYTKKFTSHNSISKGGKRKKNKSKRRSKKTRKNRKTKRRRY